MKTTPELRIACQDLNLLENRITKAPIHLITDPDELRAGGYQEEGVIVADFARSQRLGSEELKSIAVDPDTPDALRLVRVPQRPGLFMEAFNKTQPAYASLLGSVPMRTEVTTAQSPWGIPHTTINTAINAYVGLHIDVTLHGEDRYAPMMGVVCGPGGRGLTICPGITMDTVDTQLHIVGDDPEERLARREQIRAAAQRLSGELVAYTVWLKGSTPDDTYEAYANNQPRNMLHDGTTFRSFPSGTSTIQLFHTKEYVGPDMFPSVI